MKQVSLPGSCTYHNARKKMGALTPSSVTQLPGSVGVWTVVVMSCLELGPHPISSHLVQVHSQ